MAQLVGPLGTVVGLGVIALAIVAGLAALAHGVMALRTSKAWRFGTRRVVRPALGVGLLPALRWPTVVGVSAGDPLRIVGSGGLEIWVGDQRVDTAIPAKAALVVLFLADHGTRVPRTKLAGLLWSDHAEEQARASLRVALTRARRHVPHLDADRSSVGLRGEVTLDLDGLEGSDPATTTERYRGDVLAGVEVEGAELFDDWLATRREEHRTLVMRSLASAAEDATLEERWGDVVAFGRQMVEIERWNERGHRHVMAGLARTDGRSAALVAFEQCSAALGDEFGVPPDDETQQLADAIRRDELAAVRRETDAQPRSLAVRSITWRLLGDVTVSIGGDHHDLGGTHRRSVMAYLALNAPNRCSLGDLVAAVWDDDAPATARQSIRRHVRELRALAPELAHRIEDAPDGFRLAAAPSEVDVHEVRTGIATAQTALRQGEIEAGAAELRTAIARWRGAALGGVSRHGRLGATRVALDELRLVAIEDLIEAELALGRHREIVSEAEAFAAEHPERTRAWSNLMLARARTGRAGEAIDAYDQFCAHLAADGLEPAPSIVALRRQILDDAPVVHAAWDELGPAENSWTLPTTTLSVPLPPALDRSATVDLAGRRAELDAMTAALEEIQSGVGRAVFVTGEPGIGKTRLTAELAAQAHRAGAVVLYGRCDTSIGVPFQAWREALAHLAEHVPPHVVRRHLDRFGPALQRLMPSLVGHDVPANDWGSEPSDASQQELMFRAASDLLADVARRRPLLVVIDDMHWSDPSTVDLLRHVTRNIGEPALIVGVYRDTDIVGDHPVPPMVADLVGAGAASIVPLEELDDSARTEIVLSMGGEELHDVAPRIAARIAFETGGNPFFFTEVLRSVHESGSMRSFADAENQAVVPATVQRVVVDRVDRLGDAVAETLRVASVFGREFDLDVLSRVVDRHEESVLDDIETALSAGVVSDAPLGRDRFAFSHDLVHHTLAAQLSTSRRCRVHGRIADAYEQVYGDALGELVPVVASHLVAADDPARRPHTIVRCREAGRHAAARVAAAESIRWFERVLERLEPDEVSLRSEVMVELGVQQRNIADPAHRVTLIEAGRQAQASGDVETVVAAALANSRGMNAHVWELDHDRIESFEAALEVLGEDRSAARAELLAALANEQWDDASRDISEWRYREAITIAREVGDTAALARVLVRASRARNFKFGREEMASVSEELRVVAEARDLSDPLLLANCLTTVLNSSIRLGLADETAAAIEAIGAMADDLPLPMFTLPAHLARCLEAGLRGDIASYEARSVETFEHATAIGDEEAGFIFEGQLFYTAYLRGDLEPLVELSTNIMRERPEVPLYRAAYTLINTEAGNHDEARRVLDADVEQGIEPTVDMFQIQALVSFSDAAATLGHRAAAEQLYDALAVLTTEMSGHLVQVGEPVDISLGRLATVLERFDDADVHFDRALEIAAGYRARWMDAITRVSRCEMLVCRSAPGDVDRAREEATSVRSVAEAEGFLGIAARAAALLEAQSPPNSPG